MGTWTSQRKSPYVRDHAAKHSVCKGPEVRALLGTFCEPARRGLCDRSREGKGLSSGQQVEEWVGPDRLGLSRPSQECDFHPQSEN